MKTPKPRALTYTEMMNGGKQQLDPEVPDGESLKLFCRCIGEIRLQVQMEGVQG